MKLLVLCALLSLAQVALAQNSQPLPDQNSLPDSASASKLAWEDQFDSPSAGQPIAVRPTLSLELRHPAEKGRVVDQGFSFVTLFHIAATISDLEFTHHAWARDAEQANLLFGHHPSRAKQYAIAMPISAGVVVLSYRLKRRGAPPRHWFTPQLVVGAIHTGALFHNFTASKKHPLGEPAAFLTGNREYHLVTTRDEQTQLPGVPHHQRQRLPDRASGLRREHGSPARG